MANFIDSRFSLVRTNIQGYNFLTQKHSNHFTYFIGTENQIMYSFNQEILLIGTLKVIRKYAKLHGISL